MARGGPGVEGENRESRDGKDREVVGENRSGGRERQAQSGEEARPLPERERPLEGEESEKRRERVRTPLGRVRDREREDGIERRGREAHLRSPEPPRHGEEERQVEEGRDEGEHAHENVRNARGRANGARRTCART